MLSAKWADTEKTNCMLSTKWVDKISKLKCMHITMWVIYKKAPKYVSECPTI